MLQTFDINTGNPMLKIGDRIFKFCGIVNIGWSTTGGTKSGSISDPRLTQYPNAVPQVFSISSVFSRNGAVQLSISGNTVNWTYSSDTANQSTRPDTTFIYGFY